MGYVHLYRNRYVKQRTNKLSKKSWDQIYQLIGSEMVSMACEMDLRREKIAGSPGDNQGP
jgi:hypothetical protein